MLVQLMKPPRRFVLTLLGALAAALFSIGEPDADRLALATDRAISAPSLAYR